MCAAWLMLPGGLDDQRREILADLLLNYPGW